ncbi:glycine-rich protein DOT1-like [Miscanthus floridulus]|uniref:glycine-rich protein DOT1-like n=1 Tax=Miscanthus floridulus TaxID=154761 RepID=UPI0034592360
MADIHNGTKADNHNGTKALISTYGTKAHTTTYGTKADNETAGDGGGLGLGSGRERQARGPPEGRPGAATSPCSTETGKGGRARPRQPLRRGGAALVRDGGAWVDRRAAAGVRSGGEAVRGGGAGRTGVHVRRVGHAGGRRLAEGRVGEVRDGGGGGTGRPGCAHGGGAAGGQGSWQTAHAAAKRAARRAAAGCSAAVVEARGPAGAGAWGGRCGFDRDFFLTRFRSGIWAGGPI